MNGKQANLKTADVPGTGGRAQAGAKSTLLSFGEEVAGE